MYIVQCSCTLYMLIYILVDFGIYIGYSRLQNYCLKSIKLQRPYNQYFVKYSEWKYSMEILLDWRFFSLFAQNTILDTRKNDCESFYRAPPLTFAHLNACSTRESLPTSQQSLTIKCHRRNWFNNIQNSSNHCLASNL